jgi:hypothetical protein
MVANIAPDASRQHQEDFNNELLFAVPRTG